MNRRKLTAALSALIIALCPVLNTSAEFQPKERTDLSYSDMKYQKFDNSTLVSASDELKKIAESNAKEKDERVRELIQIMLDQYDLQATMYNIRYNDFYLDVTNESLQTELTQIQEDYQDSNDIIFSALQEIYESDYQDIITDIFDEDFIPSIAYYEDTDEEYLKLSSEELELTMKYEALSAKDYSVQYNGKTWNADELLNNPPNSQADYNKINDMLFDAKNKELGEIYCELLKVRDKIAKLCEYDNYAQYAYENLYIRDYTLDDADKMYSEVKAHFSDISNDLYNGLTVDISTSGLALKQYTSEEVLDTIEPYMSKINPLYGDNFRYMREHGLYNIDPSDTKMAAGYTTSLYSYAVPFIFDSPSGNYDDIRTMVHEFGHANVYYIHPVNALSENMGNSLDTLEIHSQGMEVLFTDYSTEIFGEKAGKVYNDYTLYAMTSSIIDGCLFDEFQRFAYENPDCTLDQLNNEYEKLCGEYGVNYTRDVIYFNDWTEIAHNYNSPMYYISYATSALSALDLWLKNADNRTEALDIYSKLIDCGGSTPYVETLETVGLRNIFDEGTINDIANETVYLLENGVSMPKETQVSVSETVNTVTKSTVASIRTTLETQEYNVEDIFDIVFPIVFTVLGIFILGMLTIVIILIVMIVKRKSKK